MYDLDDDGYIDRMEMISVVEAIHAMVGSFLQLPDEEDSPQKRVDKIFDQMDTVGFYLNRARYTVHVTLTSLLNHY